MKFNWNTVNVVDDKFRRICIDLEYKLRPKITHFLVKHLEDDCGGDYSCFHFDVDVENLYISIARPTPIKYKRKILAAFEREINQDFISGLNPIPKAG